MTDDRIARAASLFAQAWLDGTTIDAFPSELAPRDPGEATAMQDAMAARIDEDVVGWKIAGKPGAPSGRIFASTRFENGATLPLPRYANNIVECEVGFKLRSALPPRERPYEREEVAAATDLAINIELVGSRRAGVVERAAAALAAGGPFPDTEAERLLIIADNGGNLGLVTGPVIEDWQHRSLLDITVDLRIDGGESRPLLPMKRRTEPLDVLLWLANDLSRRGIGLKAGQIVTPSSVNVPEPLPAGSTAVAVFEDLGEIAFCLAAEASPAPERVLARELVLLRHGHAVPHGSVSPDFDRPLDARGRSDTVWMARWAADSDALPDLVVASTAQRARETAEGFCREAGLPTGDIMWRKRIYDSRIPDLLAVLAEVPAGPRRVMMVGHNPGFEVIAGLLGHGDPHRVRLATAAAARIRMPEDWSELAAGAGEMIEVVRPPKRR